MNPIRSRRTMISFLLVLATGVLLWPASLATSGQGIEWRVWMKVSPCSGRTDWVSVAKENPSTGGGLSFFEIFPGSRAWGSFAEAVAEANALRSSPLFANYCCRDYSVWQNSQTSKFTVVVGKFGTAGLGWQIVKGDLCCEEAFSLAGLPAASTCGAGTGSAGGMTTEHNTDRHGQDYRNFDLSQANPELCSAACASDPNCKAYTYVRPGVQGPSARCWLKSGVPAATSNTCCVSGVKGGATISKATDQDDLSGTWFATYQEPISGYHFRFQMTLSQVSTGRWQGPLDYVCVDRADLSFKAQATIQVIGPGRIRLTYSDPKSGPQQADGAYTKTQMTFGNSSARVTYTRR